MAVQPVLTLRELVDVQVGLRPLNDRERVRLVLQFVPKMMVQNVPQWPLIGVTL